MWSSRAHNTPETARLVQLRHDERMRQMASMEHPRDDDALRPVDEGYATPTAPDTDESATVYTERTSVYTERTSAYSDDSPLRTEADRIRSDDLVEPATVADTYVGEDIELTDAEKIRADGIDEDYPVGVGDEDALLTDAEKIRAAGIDEGFPAGVGDEDALLSDGEKFEARDIDQ